MSSLDSASALYPVFLPVVIALSLLATFERPFIANCILGLSALPVQLVPWGLFPLSYASLASYGFEPGHWMLSVVPLVVQQHLDDDFVSSGFDPIHPSSIDARATLENLALIYPFHQSLLSIIHYLTASSLLPAERQLLSISLINLYIFSEKPPTVILKAVIWVCGMGLILTCRQVVKLSFSMTQTPKWRFSHKHNKFEGTSGLLITLKAMCQRIVGRHETKATTTHYNESDADEDGAHDQTKQKDRRSNNLRVDGDGDCMIPHAEKKSVDGSVNILGYSVPLEKDNSNLKRSTQRHGRNSVPANHREWQLLFDEFRVNRSLHAAYVYIVAFVIILWPFRLYVSRKALGNHEAIGWIIGYLFGDVPVIRKRIEESSMSSWIPITSSSSIPPLLGVEQSSFVHFITPGNLRLLFICYWLLILTFGLRLILNLPLAVAVDTRRKVFHGMMVLILVPTAPLDPAFVSLALTIVLALFLLLELLRISGLPPLSKPLKKFLAPYVDGRDFAGPVVISHIFLLLGCSIPFWLSLAGSSSATPSVDTESCNENSEDLALRSWEPHSNFSVNDTGIDMLSGVICVGLGDAAASLIGRRYGRTRWPWRRGSKSVEGSAAFATALFIGLLLVKIRLYAIDSGIAFGRAGMSWSWLRLITVSMAKMAAASCVASFLEAVLVGGNDNIVVPVVLWVTVKGLEL